MDHHANRPTAPADRVEEQRDNLGRIIHVRYSGHYVVDAYPVDDLGIKIGKSR